MCLFSFLETLMAVQFSGFQNLKYYKSKIDNG